MVPGSYNSTSDKARCHLEFGNIENAEFPTWKVFQLSVTIIILVCCIDIIIHPHSIAEGRDWLRAIFNDDTLAATTDDTAQSNELTMGTDDTDSFEWERTTTDDTASLEKPTTATDDTASLDKQATTTDDGAFLEKQSTTEEDENYGHILKMRAYRLIKASCVLVFLCLTVGYRIALTKIQYPDYCHSSLKIASTQWWAIVCFNIMPFAFACINWLNALLFYASLRQNKRPQPSREESLLVVTLLWVSVVALVYLNVLVILHFGQWVDKLGTLAEARRRKAAEEGQKQEPIYYTWKFVDGTVCSYNSNSVGWTCIFNSAGSTAVTTMGT